MISSQEGLSPQKQKNNFHFLYFSDKSINQFFLNVYVTTFYVYGTGIGNDG